MSTFDEREKAFENKYKHDEELLFRIYARRAKLAGLWAAEQLGLSGQEAETYAKQVVAADFEEPGHEDIVRKLLADFEQKGIDISRHRIEKELEQLLVVAKDQVTSA